MIRGFLSGVVWGGVVAALGLAAVSQLTPLPVARIAADASTVQRPKASPAAPLADRADAAAPLSGAATDAPDAGQDAVAVAPVMTPAKDPASPADQLDPPAGSEFAKPLPDENPQQPAGETLPPVDATDPAPLTAPKSDSATFAEAPTAAPQTGQPPKQLETPAGAENAALAPGVDEGRIALADPARPTAPLADVAPAPTIDLPAPPEPKPDRTLAQPVPEGLAQPGLVQPDLNQLDFNQPDLPLPEANSPPQLQMDPDPALLPQNDPSADPAPAPAGENAATLTPTPGLAGKVDGVKTGRLPRIGDAAPPANTPENAGADQPGAIAPPDTVPGLMIDGDVGETPLQKYARTFENPEAKPLFAIILIDTGGPDLDRISLAELPFPVTFALDPLAPDVAAASKIYRDAGQEVIMVATGIPAGATASDLEVTFQAHASALPESVAVIDTEFGAFQADRPLATQVVPILKAQGRGLISWDRGLNAADQVARREGLAATLVFRKLDGNGESTAAVRRALDRAAFKAAQDGRVTVIGQTLPDTVAALLAWAVEGRAASVALAPVSAVLTVQ